MSGRRRRRWAAGPRPEALTDLPEMGHQSAADGLLVMDLVKNSAAPPLPGGSSGLPVVCIGVYIPIDADYVRVDLAAAAGEAVRHLLAGDGRPAYLAPALMARPGEGRYDAYLAAMAQAGLEPQVQ